MPKLRNLLRKFSPLPPFWSSSTAGIASLQRCSSYWPAFLLVKWCSGRRDWEPNLRPRAEQHTLAPKPPRFLLFPSVTVNTLIWYFTRDSTSLQTHFCLDLLAKNKLAIS